MPTIRTVTGTVLNPDGSPMVNSRVLFVLRPGSYTDDGEFPFTDHDVLTDASGDYETDLWANEEGNISSVYTGEYENGETFEFTVPVTGPSDIPTLRALFAGPTSPTFPLIQDYVDSHLGGRDLDNTLPVVAGQAYVFNGTAFVPESVFTSAEAHAAFLTQAEGDALYFPLNGTLAYAQLPNAGGTWNAGGGVVALTGSINATGTVTGTEFFGEFDASQLTGTLPPGTFPATLPASSGENLTDLNASQLTTGTIPDARFPATLPALSGANLTDLNATQLTSGTVPDGRFPATLPAVSGANLTSLNANELTSGTIPDGRFPATLPATSGANLTNLNASNLASGNVPYARMPTGSGSWDTGAATTMTLTRNAQVGGTLGVTGVSTLSSSVGIGTSGTAAFALRIDGFATSGATDQHAINCRHIVSSAATGIAAGVYARVDTTAAVFTVGVVAGFYSRNPSKGSGSTITTAYGYYCEAITSGGTNWAIFTAGTTPSSFGGAVTITGTLTANGSLIAASAFTATGGSISVSGAAGTERSVQFQTAGVNRWRLIASSVAEGGSNAGSALILQARADDGSAIGSALIFDRATMAATFGGSIIAPAATASIPSLRLPHGTAPSSPTNGDIWTTTAGLFCRINGVTKTVTLT